MSETLQEFFDSRGVPVQVDRQSGVIRGVKILGRRSRNGRTYPHETLSAAAGLYEDAKVNVNHPKGNPAGPRDYQDRIGVIRNVVVRREEGLFADFHFNPKHVLAEQLLWDAEHAPQNVGFSHNVQARVARRGEEIVVEAITRVQSVDLVADPATTRGLFESANGPANESANESHGRGPTPPESSSLEDVKRNHPELVETLCAEQLAEVQRLRAEVDRLEALDVAHQKWSLARRLLHEHQLPDPELCSPHDKALVGERLVESLMAAEDERAMRGLIEEHVRLVQALRGAKTSHRPHEKPLALDRHFAGHTAGLSTKDFVDAIT